MNSMGFFSKYLLFFTIFCAWWRLAWPATTHHHHHHLLHCFPWGRPCLAVCVRVCVCVCVCVGRGTGRQLAVRLHPLAGRVFWLMSYPTHVTWDWERGGAGGRGRASGCHSDPVPGPSMAASVSPWDPHPDVPRFPGPGEGTRPDAVFITDTCQVNFLSSSGYTRIWEMRAVKKGKKRKKVDFKPLLCAAPPKKRKRTDLSISNRNVFPGSRDATALGLHVISPQVCVCVCVCD